MNLDEFRKFVIAEREATRQQNLNKILSVASATISEQDERQTNE